MGRLRSSHGAQRPLLGKRWPQVVLLISSYALYFMVLPPSPQQIRWANGALAWHFSWSLNVRENSKLDRNGLFREFLVSRAT